MRYEGKLDFLSEGADLTQLGEVFLGTYLCGVRGFPSRTGAKGVLAEEVSGPDSVSM